MASVRRAYVEKRAGFNVEAKGLLFDLRELLGLEGLTDIRVFKRYDVENLPQDAFAAACASVFSEPNVDEVYLGELPAMKARMLCLEFLPGQYDARADAAAQCIQLLTQGERPLVRCATLYAFLGEMDDAGFAAAKGYLLNPVESREAALALPESLALSAPEPADIARHPAFLTAPNEQIAALVKERGMAMSAADLLHVRAYFRDVEKRPPTETELRVIDTYWSDHCRHTTFLTAIDRVCFETGALSRPIARAFADYLDVRASVYGARSRDVSLMDMAIIGMKELSRRGLLPDLDQSDEINACSLRVRAKVDGRDEDWLVMFKNETHNHPTEIEPYGGAATCLGGAIRDPLSGRSYVYQGMRVTGAGDVNAKVSDTLPGKLPQRRITQGAAAGFSGYGNQIGLATGQVKEIYHPGYVAKRLELGAVIGAAPQSHVRREKPAPGDVVLLVGGRTGRDGCGGATGSSKAHTADSLLSCGAEVQKGTPTTERSLQRLFRDPAASRLIKKCNDFGAGGVCVAIGELADGLRIDLDAVPKKYEGLDGTELAISESQERMAVLLAPGDAERFIALARQENLEATAVAVVTAQPRLVMSWRGDTVVDIARSFLDTNGVTQHAAAEVAAPDSAEPYFARSADDMRRGTAMPERWLHNLQQLSVCGQRGLQERFDGTIGAGTVLNPLGGAHQLTEAQAMAAKLPVAGETTTCTLMAHGFDPYLSTWSPFHGAVWAVVDALAKVAAVGGDALCARLSLQEFFERLGSDERRWGKPLAALLGALTAQLKLGVAAIGGKDSMSGSFGDIDVPPTLVAFAVAVADTSDMRSQELKGPGHSLVLLPCPRDGDHLPDFEEWKARLASLRRMQQAGLALSAHTVGMGGVAAAVTRMALGNMVGARLLTDEGLFTPDYGSFIVELAPGADASMLRGAVPIGGTIAAPAIEVARVSIPLEDCAAAWNRPLEKVFPTASSAPQGQSVRPADCARRPAQHAPLTLAKPRVVVPAFPGTNCELDTARAFTLAGGQAAVRVMRNLSAAEMHESIAALAADLKNAQILALPGGFSCGDEPDGSAKYIAAVLRSGPVKDAVHALLARGGLIIGICNGFQALIKTGLVPYGEIRDTQADDPTLTFNAVARHVARYVWTRVASVHSPWMAALNVGDVHALPVSHGEGRVVLPGTLGERLLAAGQIATQYALPDGMPTMREPYNPNGSQWAVEGLFSPDGRVFGKMAHSERIGACVGLNVPGAKDQRLFASGVSYFC